MANRKRFPCDSGEWCLGSDLPKRLQDEALAKYVHRHTGDHPASWAQQPMPNGKAYPLHFKDDADWLAHTKFPIKGRPMVLDNGDCWSSPTYPNNPEYRKGEEA